MRYPDVDWWCDSCMAYLNDQAGFTDENGTWTCDECGHVSGISSDNILSKEAIAEGEEWLRNFDPNNYPTSG